MPTQTIYSLFGIEKPTLELGVSVKSEHGKTRGGGGGGGGGGGSRSGCVAMVTNGSNNCTYGNCGSKPGCYA